LLLKVQIKRELTIVLLIESHIRLVKKITQTKLSVHKWTESFNCED